MAVSLPLTPPRPGPWFRHQEDRRLPFNEDGIFRHYGKLDP